MGLVRPGLAAARRAPPEAWYATLATLASIDLVRWRTNFFVADDWMILARYLSFAWHETPRWFLAIRQDWYRPLFEMLVAAQWRLFGLHPEGYHVVAAGLYVLSAATVGSIARALTGRAAVGAAATVGFAAFHFHAEPLLWIAAGSDLLAGACALAAVRLWMAWRRPGSNRATYGAALLAGAAAIAAKETAVLVPLLLAGYDRLAGIRGRSALAVGPLAALSGLVLAARSAAGNPYPVAPTASLVVGNARFYALMQAVAAPIDFDVSSTAAWREPLFHLPAATAALSAGCAALLAAAWVAAEGWRRGWQRKGLAYAGWWVAWSLAPVLPIVAERTAYLASAGVALAFGVVAVGAVDGTRHRPAAALAVALAASGYVGAHAAALRYRAGQWHEAARVSRLVMEEVVTASRSADDGAAVLIGNVPDHISLAWTFRNAFHPTRPAAPAVLDLDAPVRAMLDAEVAGRGPREVQTALGARPGDILVWYEDGRVESAHVR